MNSASTRSSNAYPQFNNVGETRAYLDSLRNNVIYSWHGVEHVIKYLTESHQEKNNYIEAIRNDLSASQASLHAKNHDIQQMEQTMLHLQRRLQEMDRFMQLKDGMIQRLEAALQQTLSEQQRHKAEAEEAGMMRTKISYYEHSLRTLSSEKEDLKLKLTQVQAEPQNQTDLKEVELTEEQQKTLSRIIDTELSQREKEVNAKAKELIVQIQKQSQQRIRELQEQLDALKAEIVRPVNHVDPPLPVFENHSPNDPVYANANVQ